MVPWSSVRYVYLYVVLVNYYRDMLTIQSYLLHPITTIMSYKVMFKWTDIEQKLFEDIIFIIGHNALLAYSDFNEIFDIHTDTSN